MKPIWIDVAEKEIGIIEIPGTEANKRIIEYNTATTLKSTSDEIPWCSSFINWVMKSVGYSCTGSASARSWLNYGEELHEPKLGCIVILTRGNNLSTGHVGFYVGNKDSSHILVLGGNQKDSDCISSFNRSIVIGYRWPIN